MIPFSPEILSMLASKFADKGPVGGILGSALGSMGQPGAQEGDVSGLAKAESMLGQSGGPGILEALAKFQAKEGQPLVSQAAPPTPQMLPPMAPRQVPNMYVPNPFAQRKFGMRMGF